MSHSDGSIHSYNESIINRITSAFTLITLGIFFLLNSTGVVPWSAWGTVFLIFIRIWPIFIIFAGLQIIFGKVSIFSAIISILSSLVFAFVLIFAAVLNTTDNSFKTQLERNIPFINSINIKIPNENYISKELVSDVKDIVTDEVNTRVVTLDFTNETFTVNGSKELTDYLKLNAKYYSNIAEPYLDTKVENNSINITSGAKYITNSNFIMFNSSPEFDYTLGQADLNTLLDIKMTSGDGSIDLRDLNVKQLILKETSGNTTLNFMGSQINIVDLQLTSGNSELNFDKDSLLKVTYTKTSGNLRINGSEVENKSNVVYVGDLASKTVVNVNVQLTSGNVDINTK